MVSDLVNKMREEEGCQGGFLLGEGGGPLLMEMQILSSFAPECLRIVQRLAVHAVILLPGRDVRFLGVLVFRRGIQVLVPCRMLKSMAILLRHSVWGISRRGLKCRLDIYVCLCIMQFAERKAVWQPSQDTIWTSQVSTGWCNRRPDFGRLSLM